MIHIRWASKENRAGYRRESPCVKKLTAAAAAAMKSSSQKWAGDALLYTAWDDYMMITRLLQKHNPNFDPKLKLGHEVSWITRCRWEWRRWVDEDAGRRNSPFPKFCILRVAENSCGGVFISNEYITLPLLAESRGHKLEIVCVLLQERVLQSKLTYQ